MDDSETPRYREQRHATGWTTWSVAAARPRRIIPDANLDLIWDGSRIVVAGPDITAFPVAPGAATGLRLPPGLSRPAFGVDIHRILGLRVDLADLTSPRFARRAHAGLHRDPEQGLVQLLGALLSDVAPADVARATRLHRAVRTGMTVADATAAAGLSARQAHRVARAEFGYSLETLRSILRFHRAAVGIRAGRPLADVATATGYADQSHMTRHVTRFAGCSPRLLRAEALDAQDLSST